MINALVFYAFGQLITIRHNKSILLYHVNSLYVNHFLRAQKRFFAFSRTLQKKEKADLFSLSSYLIVKFFHGFV